MSLLSKRRTSRRNRRELARASQYGLERCESRLLLSATALTVNLPASGWEGQSLSSSISIDGTLGSNLVVSLQSLDTSELTVPATVTILAGLTSVAFTASFKTDNLRDGAQTAQVNATASGLTDGSSSTTVRDRDLDHLGFDTITGSKTAGVNFSVTSRAYNIDNEQIAVYSAGNSLSASGQSGTIPVNPTIASFSGGAWTGNVAVNGVDPAITLNMTSGSIVGTSNSFAVQVGPMAGFAWNTISTPQATTVPFNVTARAVDAHGFLIPDFNGSAALSGLSGGSVTSSIMTSDTTELSTFNNVPYSVGYIFTPKVNMLVTHVRSYFGSKVTIWTNTGTLVASQNVTGPNGSWTDTQLPVPVLLTANTAYRLVDYTNGETAYFGDRTTQSSLVTVGQTLEFPGDRFPSITDSRLWMVDLRGDFGTFSTVTTSPATATFVNGVWNGSVTVGQIVSNMRLRVDGAGGFGGESNTFNVVTGTPTPQTPTLLAVSDSGRFDDDLITNLNNSGATKKLQFSIGGTVPGAKVDLIRNGAVIGTATAADTITIVTTNGTTFLPDGNQSFSARQTIGVNPSLDSAALVVAIDTAGPGSPSALDLQATSDSGISKTDNITNINTPVFNVNASPYFRVFRDGVQVSGDYLTGNTFNAATLADGSSNFTVKAVDVAGNPSSPSLTLVVTIDTVAPAAPSAPDLQAASDSGISSNDNFTKNRSLGVDLIGSEPGILRMEYDGSSGTGPRLRINSAGTFSQTVGSLITGFLPTQTYAAGTQPEMVATGDINNDGFADVITDNIAAGSLYIYLANPDGTLQTPTSLSPPSAPAQPVLADFNHDGNLDLAVKGTTIAFYLGKGDGTFQSPLSLAGGSGFYLAAADVNGDNEVDLVANGGGTTVNVFLGNGNGTFQNVKTSTLASSVLAMGLADYDGDHKVDLVAGNVSSGILFARGNGDGTFQAGSIVFAGGSNAIFATATDLDDDGDMDIVGGDNVSQNLYILLGNGNGTFQTANVIPVVAGSQLVVADLNNDGDKDIAATNNSDSSLIVAYGNGDGTVQPPITYPAGSGPFGIAAADLNGDGRLDLVCANTGSNNLSVLLSATGPLADGEHTFSAQMEDLAGNKSPFSAVLTVTIDNVAPTAPTGQYNYETGPSLQLTFAEPVALDNSALVLNDLSHGGTAGTSLDLTNPVATFTFTSPNGILPDGNYHAHIETGDFADLAGNVSTQKFDFDFYVLGGDANRDRTVDLSDMILLSDNWFTSGKTFSQGDFNYDGKVDAKDLTIIAHNWQVHLDEPAPQAPAMSLTDIAPTGPVNASTATIVEQPTQAAVTTQTVQAPPPVVVKPDIAKPVIVAQLPKPVVQSASEPVVQPPVIPLIQKPIRKPVAATTVKHVIAKPAIKKPIVTVAKKPAAKGVAKPAAKRTDVSKVTKLKKTSNNAMATLHAPPPAKKTITTSARNWLANLLGS